MSGDRELTLGESRVGVRFNPSNDADIEEIKRQAARLIDTVQALPIPPGEQEAARLRAVAMTEIEGAAMWAVKAAARASMARNAARDD